LSETQHDAVQIGVNFLVEVAKMTTSVYMPEVLYNVVVVGFFFVVGGCGTGTIGCAFGSGIS